MSNVLAFLVPQESRKLGSPIRKDYLALKNQQVLHCSGKTLHEHVQEMIKSNDSSKIVEEFELVLKDLLEEIKDSKDFSKHV